MEKDHFPGAHHISCYATHFDTRKLQLAKANYKDGDRKNLLLSDNLIFVLRGNDTGSFPKLFNKLKALSFKSMVS